MKLSNKILAGFFGFIFLYLTAAFAELRMKGIPNIINDKNGIVETADLPKVGYVIVNGIKENVRVIGSDQPRLEVRSLAGDALKKLKYSVSGDTLTLSGIAVENTQTIRVLVFVPKTTFKGITANNATTGIEGLRQPRLRISQNAGHIWMSDSRIDRVEIDASNKSFLDINTIDIDTLSVTIDRSQVLINASVELVQGSITNDSFLRLSGIREIQLKKDKSSRLNMNQ